MTQFVRPSEKGKYRSPCSKVTCNLKMVTAERCTEFGVFLRKGPYGTAQATHAACACFRYHLMCSDGIAANTEHT